jgi:hypothetical protein
VHNAENVVVSENEEGAKYLVRSMCCSEYGSAFSKSVSLGGGMIINEARSLLIEKNFCLSKGIDLPD